MTYLFKTFTGKCNDINLKFEQKSVIIDFEMAIHTAVANMGPVTNII